MHQQHRHFTLADVAIVILNSINELFGHNIALQCTLAKQQLSSTGEIYGIS